jgi:hypothetical protein
MSNDYDEDQLLFDTKTEEIVEELQDLDQDKLYDKLPCNLSYEQNFSKSGKQGVLGLLSLDSGKKCVYKISQYINFLVDQENIILNSLNELREYLPHYVRGLGKFKVKVNSDFRKVDNPFIVSSKHNVYNDVLLMEHIDETRKLYRYIKNEEVEEEVIYSLIKQVLLAISIAQKYKRLTHYDLHSNNVLVKLCNPNSVFLYIIDDDTYYAVPTYGYYPVIIDFGFGYIGDMDSGPLYAALAHTEVGFLSHTYDRMADPKLFLVSVSHELKKFRGTKKAKIFRNLVKNIFEPLNIDWECGWDNLDDTNCSDKVYKMIRRESKISPFFHEYGHYCVDLMQRLIDLPIQKRKYKQIDDVYRMIVEEFHNIETEISSKFYNLYIFKCIVEAASAVKEEYSNSDDTEEAVRKFKRSVLSDISEIAKYCSPKLDWDRLLCSILVFARQMEGVMYDHITPRIQEKEEEYSEMEIKSTEDIYEAIEANIPGHFEFNADTDVYVWDCVNKVSKKIKLPERYINKLNTRHPLERGKVLYNYYKNL